MGAGQEAGVEATPGEKGPHPCLTEEDGLLEKGFRWWEVDRQVGAGGEGKASTSIRRERAWPR